MNSTTNKKPTRLPDTVTIRIKRDDLLKLGMVFCSTPITTSGRICGHWPNQHFDNGKCAHCDCEHFHEDIGRGEVIDGGG